MARKRWNKNPWNKNPFNIKKTCGNKIEETFKSLDNYSSIKLSNDGVINKDLLVLRVRKRARPLAPEIDAYEYIGHDGSKGVIIDGPETILYKGEYMPLATKVAIRKIMKKIAKKFNINNGKLVINPINSVIFADKGILLKKAKDSKQVKKFTKKSLISNLKAEAEAFYLLAFGKRGSILLDKGPGDGLLDKEELHIYYNDRAIFIPRIDMINAVDFELRKMIRYFGGIFTINIDLSDILIEDDDNE